MNEVSKTILKYLKKADWKSPKEIEEVIYPIFKKQYSEDTFARLVRRSLKELVNSEQIIKHEIQSLYLHSDYMTLLNSRDSAESLMKHVEDLRIGHLPFSHIFSMPITKIPIIKSAKIEEENRKNLPFEIKVLYDYIEGLSTIKIAKKYDEISNKNEAVKVIKKGIGRLCKIAFPKNKTLI